MSYRRSSQSPNLRVQKYHRNSPDDHDCGKRWILKTVRPDFTEFLIDILYWVCCGITEWRAMTHWVFFFELRTTNYVFLSNWKQFVCVCAQEKSRNRTKTIPRCSAWNVGTVHLVDPQHSVWAKWIRYFEQCCTFRISRAGTPKFLCFGTKE